MDQPVTMEVELPPDQTSTATTESATATTITVTMIIISLLNQKDVKNT